MFAFPQRIYLFNMRNKTGVALNEQRKECNGQDGENSSRLDSSVNDGVLHLERVSSLDIHEHSYGKARRSVEDSRLHPYGRNESCNKTLEDRLYNSFEHCHEKGRIKPEINGKFFPVGIIEEEKEFEGQQYQKRDFMSPMAKEKGSISGMLQITRDKRTKGDIEEILKEREKIYGKNLDPN